MAVSRALCFLALSGYGSAFVVRRDTQLTVTAGATNNGLVSAISSQTISHSFTSTHDSKTYSESTNVGQQTDAHDTPRPTIISEGPETRSSVHTIDIGPIIGSWITTQYTVHPESTAPGWETTDTTTLALPTVHPESTAPGWETVAPTSSSNVIVSSEAGGHVEKPEPGWETTYYPNPPAIIPTKYVPEEGPSYPTAGPSHPTHPATPGKPQDGQPQPSRPAVPGRPGEAQPQRTSTSVKTITEYPAPPAVTHDGVTIQPIAVTHRPTLTRPDGTVTTSEKVNFEIVVGSSTLGIGTTITVNNVAIGLTTDASGSTVFHAGDMTTTLPEPTAGEVRTITADAPQGANVVTTIVSGTTKYILAGQTLAPGQPVTVGDTPVSITIISDKTVLYVGDKTTTLTPGNTDRHTVTDSPETATQTGSTGATSTSKNSGSQPQGEGLVVIEHFAMFMMSFMGLLWI